MFRLFKRKEKKEEKLINLEELILSLESEPSLQSAVVEKYFGKVLNSKNENLIDRAILILAENSRYDRLTEKAILDRCVGLLYQEKILPQERIIHMAEYCLQKHKTETALNLLIDLFKESNMEEARQKIRNIITSNSPYSRNYKYYENRPVTAFKTAVAIEDYELIGLTFAYLRKEGSYISSSHENYQIKELRGSFIDPSKLSELCGRSSRIEYKDKEKAKLLRDKEDRLWQRLIDGFNSLLLSVSNPKKAFEAVGDSFLNYSEFLNGEHSIGDYGLAIEYYISSENADKLYNASVEATLEHKEVLNPDCCKYPHAKHSDYMAAFKGFKTILTKFDISDAMKANALKELKEKFGTYELYRFHPELARESAELMEDSSQLQANFYYGIERSGHIDVGAYNLLNEHRVLDNDKVLESLEIYLKTIKSNPNGEFKRVLDIARLVPDKNIKRSLIIELIANSGLRADLAIEGFNYLKERGQAKPEDEEVYSLITN